MKKALILAFALLCGHVQAQVEFGPRHEQIHDFETVDYLVISNEEQGAIVLERELHTSAAYPIRIKHLDKNLKVKWQTEMQVPQRFAVRGYHYSGGKTYLLLQNRVLHSVKIVRIDAQQKRLDEFETKRIVELDVREFEVVQNTAVIGGYFEERPAVFAYVLDRNIVRTLAGVYQNRSELLEVKVNSDDVTFNVLVSKLDDKKDRTVQVNTYDFQGEPIRDYQLEVKRNFSLINAMASSINDISQVVVGLYGINGTTSVAGFYVNHIDRTGEQTMTYHNLGTLPRYLDHLGEKRANKLKSKAAAMKKSGKEQKYRAEVMIRELIEEDGKLIVSGEFHKPTESLVKDDRLGRINRTNRFMGMNTNSPANDFNPVGVFGPLNTGVPIDDFFMQVESETEFTHAYMLVLDQDGNIEWDDYAVINKEKEGWLQEFGRFQWLGHDQGAYLSYFEEDLKLKVLDGSDNTEVLTTTLPMKSAADELRHERDDTLRAVRWYDNNFLVYGVQHVRPKDKSDDLRKVFFINKIAATTGPTGEKVQD